MNKQRKVLITITYNEMGIITDTKAEEVTRIETNCSEIPNSSDAVSRQAAIDALDCINGVEEVLRSLPSVQPEPAIPLSWIDEQIERLKGLDNAFATLTALQISGMVKKWRDEQDG